MIFPILLVAHNQQSFFKTIKGAHITVVCPLGWVM